MNPEELARAIAALQQGGLAGAAPPPMNAVDSTRYAPQSMPQAPVAPPSTRPLSLWERVAGVPNGGIGLTEEERRASKRGGIAGAIEGLFLGGPFGAIAGRSAGARQGIETMDAFMARRLEQAAQQQQQAWRAKYANADLRDPNTLQDMFLSASAIPGMEKVSGSLAEVLKTLKGGDSFKVQAALGPDGKRTLLRIGATGPAENLGYTGVPTDRAQQLKAVMQPDGTVSYEAWDPDKEGTNAFTPTGKRAPSFAGEGERRAAFFTPLIDQMSGVFDKFDGAPGRIEKFLSEAGARELTSDAMQQLQIAGNVYGEAWLRMTTGAQANLEEIKNAGRLFTPLPGDKPGALALKRQMRMTLKQMMQSAEGRAALNSSFAPKQPQGGNALDEIR